MIDVKYKGEIHTIYERPDELPDDAVISDIDKCAEGDIILSSNGYYVRVISVKEKTRNGKVYKYIELPWKWIIKTEKRRTNFNYDPRAITTHPKIGNLKKNIIINLIKRGIDIPTAIRYVLKRPIKNVIYSILFDYNFIDTISEVIKMESMKERFKRENIDEDFIVREVKNILLDKRSHPNLRRWALEYTIRVLNSDERKVERKDSIKQASESLSTYFKRLN